MSHGAQTLPGRLVNALIDAGTWMSRAELQAAGDCSDVALDDALADLVVDGQATWRENVGYRLVGTQICRRAAQLMRRQGKAAAMCGVALEDGYHVGVAQARADLGLVMYELALPLAAEGEDRLAHHLRQVDGVIKFFNEGVVHG